MRRYEKEDYPVDDVRRFLEPGPVVWVSTAGPERPNVMTMGWHMVMEFTPSLVGCVIARGNYSHALLREQGDCVINLPSSTLVDTVVAVGNCSGADTDKFAAFGLTAEPAEKVSAPLIAECFASLECRVADDSWVDKYDMFVLEVLKAHVAPLKKMPETVHYTGSGRFQLSGRTISRRAMFQPEML